VIVLDVEMPVMGAQAAMRRISRLQPQPKVVIVTMFAKPRLVRELLNLGASAYLLKSASLKELLYTIHAVVRGQRKNQAVLALPQEVLNQMDDGQERRLSDRELEVLSLVASGMSNDQVAIALHLVEGTVKRHLHSIYSKLEVGSRSAAVRKALSEGWITVREVCL
jgi:DNA-binding NarL/FixJ family response regulator